MTTKQIEVEALYEPVSGTYIKWENGDFRVVSLVKYEAIKPADIIGTATDPRIFNCNPITADAHLLSDRNIVDKMIEDGKYTREEWDNLSAEEKDDIIDDFLYECEQDGSILGERSVEWRTITFSVEDGIVKDVKEKTQRKFSVDQIRLDLGKQIKLRRVEEDLTIEALALESGVQTYTISKVENGANVNLDTIIKLANALGQKITLTPKN